MCFRGWLHALALFLIAVTCGCSSLRGVRGGFEEPLSYENGELVLDVPVLRNELSPLHPFKTLAKYWRLSHGTLLELKTLTEHPDLFASEKADLLLSSLAESEIFVHASPLSNEEILARLKHGVPVLVIVATEPLSPATISWWLIYGHSSEGEWKAAGFNQNDWIADNDLKAWRQNALNIAVIVCPEQAVQWPLSQAERYSLARHFELKEDWPQALDVWTELSRHPHRAEDWIHRGNVERQIGMSAAAQTSYEQAIFQDPTHPSAFNNLAFLMLEAGGQADVALENVEKALALDPGDPHLLDTKGFALMQLKRFNEASAVLEKARSRAKDLSFEEQIEIHQRLAQSYDELGLDHLVRQVDQQINVLMNQIQRRQSALKKQRKVDLPSECGI